MTYGGFDDERSTWHCAALDRYEQKMSSPPLDSPSNPYRLGGLRAFIPLADDSAPSNRRAFLPGLLQSRSSNNFADLHQYAPPSSPRPRRRPSSVHHVETTSRRGREHDVEAQADRGSEDGDHLELRRKSTAAAVLTTPQMRSQRLIGNSNPRYRW